MGVEEERIRAVTAYPTRLPSRGNMQWATPLTKPSFRLRTANCSMAFETEQASSCSSWSRVSGAKVLYERSTVGIYLEACGTRADSQINPNRMTLRPSIYGGFRLRTIPC